MEIQRKKVSIVGMGYVGLCLAAGLSSFNHKVICVDIDQQRIEMLKKGIAPIHEPKLPELIKEGVHKGLLEATTDIMSAIKSTDITFICVGTPCDDNGYIDLRYIKDASRDIGKALKEKDSYHVISVKSTVIPGTTDSHVIPNIEEFSGKKAGQDFGVCMTPEFLKEGNAIDDFLYPDKIVIGSINKQSSDWIYEVFSEFWTENYGKNVFLFCDLRTAEMIKYANNSFLATKISFINEMANLSEIFGVDVKIVSKAIGMDKRISPYFLNAGLGFGGSCFPKDVKALYSAGKSAGYISRILDSTLEVNEYQPFRPIETLKKIIGDPDGKTIALLGLSFKPETDDIRFAPSIKIAQRLLKEKAIIRAYDPVAIENFKNESGISPDAKISYYSSSIEALKGADAVLIITEWKEFSSLKPENFLNSMKSPIIIDGRRIYEPEIFENTKITYRALGYSKSKEFSPK